MTFLDAIQALCSSAPMSDLILQPGEKVAFILNDAQQQSDVFFDDTDVPALLATATPALSEWPCDESHGLVVGRYRFRANFVRTRGAKRAVLRLLPASIPPLEDLRLPPMFVKAAMTARRGIFLVCGETGSGKSTVLASIVRARSHATKEHVLTIEEPIEFIHSNSNLPLQYMQREVGRGKDAASFSAALESGMRVAPRIIVLGEIRDPLSAEIAVRAGNSGHILFSTLHTGTISESVESLLTLVPAAMRDSARVTFPSVMAAVMCTRLVPDGKGRRFGIHELLMPSTAVASLIRRGEYAGLPGQLTSDRQAGHQTFAQSLSNALRDGVIEARQHAVLATRIPTIPS